MVAASADIKGVNELVSGSSAFTQSVLDRMLLKLFEEQPDFDQGPPTFAPLLARSWQRSEDGRTLRIELRDDVRWSDGSRVTAVDVEWTWRAQTHPDVAWALADSKTNILSVEALDATTVEVTFREVNASQLSDLNEGAILPSAAWSRLPFADWHHRADWFVENLVTNGPFRLADWRRQQEIVLVRNPDYFVDDRPRVDRIVFRIVPQKVNLVGHLVAEEVQFVQHVPPAEADRFARSESFQLLDYPTRQYNFIAWNTRRPQFSSDRSRRALTLAIDRQALVDALWFGRARVAVSPIVSTVWAHNDDLEPWPYDPRQASALLAEEGWYDSNGDGILDRDGNDFVFELMTNSDSVVRVDAAVMVQDQLRRVGVRVEVQRLEFNTLSERVQAHDFDAFLGGWMIDTSLDLDYAFHSDSIDGGYNFGGFSDAEVDRLLDEVRSQSDPQKLEGLLREVQAVVHRQQPYTFLWEPRRLAVATRALRNATPNALDPFFHVEDWWLEPGR